MDKWIDEIKWGKDNLVPVIVQETETGLMSFRFLQKRDEKVTVARSLWTVSILSFFVVWRPEFVVAPESSRTQEIGLKAE